jgi:hypothetical protein
VVSPIFSVGKSAKQIEMSIAVMTNSTDFDELLRRERAVVGEELHQVERRQVARRVVQVHCIRCTGWTP